ncbi:MAG: response regulator transcription factor [Candidatus Tectomicrobia bacterium]|uniref:Response regulator transcription factor n=1 Tax=Tectimicrobiota bacterium TaxID=2528274 RepID=A0A937W201_UNCTE|nr:response regulator transcription factor [Candidatus Tectomicrobia bacterium]
MARKPRLLIIEDEPAILTGLLDLFVYHGYEVEAAQDGQRGLEKALSESYDLIILDIMLPMLDGFAVCDAIRHHSREQPLIMLTAKTTDEDVITGLTLGADDYVAKPFSVRELVLRVEAVLRRSARQRYYETLLSIGTHLQIDTRNLVGTWAGSAEPVLFTRREIEILQYLQQHHERPVSREELLTEVWGYAKASRFETRTVDIHMAKLRRKVEPNPKAPQWLVTIRGEGYKLLTAS